MTLEVLATGSAGNCYVLRAGPEALILDAGIKYLDILQGMGYDLGPAVGALITHEHKDHSRAADALAMAGVDIYTSRGTAAALCLQGHRINTLPPLQQFYAGGFLCRAFPAEHDAAEPFGYQISRDGMSLVYLTDSYFSRYTFPGTHYYLIECNYIDAILAEGLESGRIPAALKQRLRGSHMSLDKLIKLLTASGTEQTRQIILAHLSDSNSDEARMVEAVEAATGTPTMAAAAGQKYDLSLCPF